MTVEQPPERLRRFPLFSARGALREGGRRPRGGAALARRPLGWGAPIGYAVLLAMLFAAPLRANAQAVALSGVLGSKALLVVDGSAPRAVAAGEAHKGVQVVSVGREEAVVLVGGERRMLRLGESPVSVRSAVQRVVLQADAQGHFVHHGRINGKAMQYMVDTGASAVSIGQNDADRMGIRYRSGQPVQMQTANGVASGWRLRLDSVHIGDVELRGVEAIVTQQSMPFVLLGNSVLTQFNMTRSGNEMVLEKR